MADLITLAECPPGLFRFNGTLGFKSEYGEAGAAFEEIEVRGEGPLFETGFNAKYLLDYLEQTDAGQMVFRVREGTDPARLDPQLNTKGAAGIVNVIMPVRV